MTNAYVTLLFTHSYLPGALTLASVLRKNGINSATTKLVLMVTQDVYFSRDEYEQVDALYDEIVCIDELKSTLHDELVVLGRQELAPTYSKLELFKLVKYDKVLYLDLDTLPLKNLNHLFHVELNENEILASPDSGWPDIFNSGVFLVKPSLQTYRKLVEFSQQPQCSFDGADQGLLNQFFAGHWQRLPFTYNVTPTGQYQYTPAYNYFKDRVMLLHFAGETKPWECEQPNEFQRKWQKEYHSVDQSAINHQLLLDPDSFKELESVEEVQKWDPAESAPGKSDEPEAAKLQLHEYKSWQDDARKPIAQEESAPPGVFPWEKDRDQFKVQRVFYEYDTATTDRILQKLKPKKKKQGPVGSSERENL